MKPGKRSLGLTAALLVGLPLAACAPVADVASPSATKAEFAPLLYGDAPTTMVDMSGASTLQIERYRPQRILPACKTRTLPAAQPDPAMAEALQAAQSYSDEQQGYGLIILKDGAVIHRGFDAGVTGKTKTVSASMMKSVMAIMVGIAIDRRFIGSVDDPASQYLPEWREGPRAQITIRDLLTMSSGLAPQPFAQFLFAPDANAVAISSAATKQPGEEFRYNNAVSQVVGAILDRQVKAQGYEGFAEFLYRDLWCPLGNGEAILWTDETGMPRTYAGLHAGLEDWARIGELIRNRGKVGETQVVSAKWIEAMGQPSAANSQYGFQVWRAGEWTAKRRYSADNPIAIPHAEPFAADDVVYFDGFGGQRVYVVPSKGLTIARVGQVNLEYDDAIVPNLLIRAAE